MSDLYGSVDWDAYGCCRAFSNWSLRDEAFDDAKQALDCWDAKTMMARLAKAGVTNFTLDVRSQWSAHYPSKLMRPAPVLDGRDLFGELIEAGKQYGIKVVGYIPTGSAGFATVEHLDWAVQDRYGKPLEFAQAGFYRACTNTGYRAFEIECQREIIQRYPNLAGLWYDGPGYGNDWRGDHYCYCPSCRELFAKQYGCAIPEQPEWGSERWANYIAWRVQCTVDVTRAYYEAVKALRPDLPITANVGFIGWEGAGEETCRWIDQVGLEYGFYGSAYVISLMKAAAKGKPVEVYAHATPKRLAVGLPAAEVTYQTRFAFTYGAVPNYTWGNDEVLRKAYDDIKVLEPLCRDAQPMRWCGLVHSQKTRYLHDRGLWAHRYKYENYGQFAMLEDEHLPCSIVLDDDLERGDLSGYDVIVLPDTAIISEAAANHLRHFLEQGGGLVATEHSSLRNNFGAQRNDFLLNDLLGVRYVGQGIPDNNESASGYELPVDADLEERISWPITEHAIFAGDKVAESGFSPLTRGGDGQHRSLCCKGRRTWVAANPGTEVLVGSESEPIVTLNKVGKGKVVYIAANIGTSYRTEPQAWLHTVYGNVLKLAARNEPVMSVDAPSYCKCSFFEKDGRWLVHFLADWQPFGRWPNVLGASRIVREDDAVIEAAHLTVNTSVRSAKFFPDNTLIKIGRLGRQCQLQLGPIKTHGLLVLDV